MYTKEDKKIYKISGIIFGLALSTALITYIILGCTIGLWGKAWTLFLVPIVVSGITQTIAFKNIEEFPYTTLIVTIYLTLCAWVFDYSLWHPLWVMFLTIPLFSIVKDLIKTIRK